MAFLNFNKAELVNLSYSLKREIICANKQVLTATPPLSHVTRDAITDCWAYPLTISAAANTCCCHLSMRALL